MSNRWITPCVILVALSVLGCAYGQGKFELKREEVGSSQRISQLTRQYVRSVTEKPGGIKKEPEGLSVNHVYLSFGLLGKTLYFIVDGNPEAAKLWADSDLDGDLAEEKAIEGKKGNTNPPFDFGTVELDVPVEKGTVKLLAGLCAYVWEKNAYIYVSQRTVQAGDIEIGGKKVRVEIADANFDGRYDGLVNADLSNRADAISFTFVESGVKAVEMLSLSRSRKSCR